MSAKIIGKYFGRNKDIFTTNLTRRQQMANDVFILIPNATKDR